MKLVDEPRLFVRPDPSFQQKRGSGKIKIRLSAEESFNLGGGKQIREKKKAAITLQMYYFSDLYG